MATETETTETTYERDVGTRDWALGALGGFVGSLAFGLMMQFVMPAPLLEMAIPAMYGIEGPALAAGWAFHGFHGVVLGLAYVAVVRIALLDRYARNVGGGIGLGALYGIATTVVLAVLVMSLWLQTVGFAGAPPFPNVSIPGTIMSTIGHVVYGVLLGVVYAAGTSR